MPSSDYTSSAIVGGGLKLKGAKDSGVKKSKKKKSKLSRGEDAKSQLSSDSKLEGEDSAVQKALADEEQEQEQNGDTTAGEKQREDDVIAYGKTEAQRRHEERRRKRLDERLKREGVKTHKERVEELNKYLSNLSEHHDMPRIGPG